MKMDEEEGKQLTEQSRLDVVEREVAFDKHVVAEEDHG